jgi:hypothetical protein
LLPSGPGGVRRFPSRGAQPSTPSRAAHSTRTTLKREFNPAVADCGLQGTATSPSSTAKPRTCSSSCLATAVMAEGVGFEPTAQGFASCTAFPVPHLRPLGHPSDPVGEPPHAQQRMAEGRGFEPPRDLRPYPISSRTPSTGLGHPSASSYDRRLDSKNSRSSAALPASCTPPVTSARWLSRVSPSSR